MDGSRLRVRERLLGAGRGRQVGSHLDSRLCKLIYVEKERSEQFVQRLGLRDGPEGLGEMNIWSQAVCIGCRMRLSQSPAGCMQNYLGN
jgi:hypothetical protein